MPKASTNGSNEGSNISDDALLNLSVKDLNKLLKTLSQDERTKLKRRRRILKNRGYAANCRTKRMSQKERLQLEKVKLETEVRKMRHTNDMLKVKLDSINDRFNDLQNYAKILKSSKKWAEYAFKSNVSSGSRNWAKKQFAHYAPTTVRVKFGHLIWVFDCSWSSSYRYFTL